MTESLTNAIDYSHLLRLRLVIARLGERDNAGWWNTQGQIGRLGASVVQRGLPRTHSFARARSVFAVAAARCQEVFDPPRALTLWKLPATLEDGFDAAWEHWLADGTTWRPFFDQLEALNGDDVLGAMKQFGLVSGEEMQVVRGFRTTAAGKAVEIPAFQLHDRLLTLLAGGFAFGKPGTLVVPYSSLEA